MMTERQALAIVRDNLRNGTFVHIEDPEDEDQDPPVETKPIFNMGFAGRHHECGSVACIGGWVAFVRKHGGFDPKVDPGFDEAESEDYVVNTQKGSPLFPLYYPNVSYALNYYSITPEQAAQAIDNYLVHEDPKWEEIIS